MCLIEAKHVPCHDAPDVTEVARTLQPHEPEAGEPKLRPESKARNAMNNEPLVLAVDDEPGVLRLIKLELSSQGLRVVTASDGEEAMRIAEQQRPDMVILDI